MNTNNWKFFFASLFSFPSISSRLEFNYLLIYEWGFCLVDEHFINLQLHFEHRLRRRQTKGRRMKFVTMGKYIEWNFITK